MNTNTNDPRIALGWARRIPALLLSFGLAIGFTACDDNGEDDGQADDETADDEACVPGETQACACPAGAMGAQTCGPDGNSFGQCDCGTGDSSGDGDGDPSGDGDPTGSSGTAECAHACSVDDDCVDGLECLTFGDGSKACGPIQCQSCLVDEVCIISDFDTCVFDSCEPPECPYTSDSECDEPEGTGLCSEGTDTFDCAPSPTCLDYCNYDSDCGLFESCLETTEGWMCLPEDCQACFGDGLTCGANWTTCEFTECGDGGN